MDKRMKYNELMRLLKKSGCYDTGKYFKVSNHGSAEVASGTLKAIKHAAGI